MVAASPCGRALGRSGSNYGSFTISNYYNASFGVRLGRYIYGISARHPSGWSSVRRRVKRKFKSVVSTSHAYISFASLSHTFWSFGNRTYRNHCNGLGHSSGSPFYIASYFGGNPQNTNRPIHYNTKL